MRNLRIAMILCAAFAAGAFAEEVVLNPDGSGHYPNIQAAIDAVGPGSNIWLSDGTWSGAGNRDLDFGGKQLGLRSISEDPSACVFDLGGGGFRALSFTSGEGSDCLVRGIGFENASGLDFGGVVYVNGASPRFENCRFEGNLCNIAGGCVYVQNSSMSIHDCLFHNNYAGQSGAALSLAQDNLAYVENCRFTYNWADMMGGAIEVYDGAPVITGCVFWNNTAVDWAGGAVHFELGQPILSYCTFDYNNCGNGSHVSSQYSGCQISYSIFTRGNSPPITTGAGNTYSLLCCDLWSNTGGDFTGEFAGLLGVDGNFSEDPQYCGDHLTGDFRLQSDSPCAPGNGDCPESLIGALPVACGTESAELSSWSRVKSLY